MTKSYLEDIVDLLYNEKETQADLTFDLISTLKYIHQLLFTEESASFVPLPKVQECTQSLMQSWRSTYRMVTLSCSRS